MRSTIFPSIPFDTAKAALEVFGRENTYLVIGDHVDDLFDNIFPRNSSTPIQDYRLAIFYLSTIFQYIDFLPDSQAVDALRVRLDWKYALHAALHPIPMETSLLCEFRRLVSSEPGVKQNFQTLLHRLANIPELAFNDSFTVDADLVIHRICTTSRIAKTWDAFNNALQALAIRKPDWLRTSSLPYWYERYRLSQKGPDFRAEWPELETFAQTVGSDGFYLLDAINSSGTKDLMDIPEVLTLRKNWAGQFERGPDGVTWRKEACANCLLSGYVQKAAWDGNQSQQGGKAY